MKTLIIHPTDHTTAMLSPIYSEITDAEVITDIPAKEVLLRKAAEADRVICIGHGLPQGLINTCSMSLCVDDDFAEIFRRQHSNIYIWCNADVYMKRHGLSGFATGMFISETREARVFNVPTTEDLVTESNTIFTTSVTTAVNSGLSNEDTARLVLLNYRTENNANRVIAYNRPRIFAFNRGVEVVSAEMADLRPAGFNELQADTRVERPGVEAGRSAAALIAR